jgi:hypothetical protein
MSRSSSIVVLHGMFPTYNRGAAAAAVSDIVCTARQAVPHAGVINHQSSAAAATGVMPIP